MFSKVVASNPSKCVCMLERESSKTTFSPGEVERESSIYFFGERVQLHKELADTWQNK